MNSGARRRTWSDTDLDWSVGALEAAYKVHKQLSLASNGVAGNFGNFDPWSVTGDNLN